MIEIVAGTDRPGSRTLQVAKLVRSFFQELPAAADILDLASAPLGHLTGAAYNATAIKEMSDVVTRVNLSRGVVMVIPEYNGSFPGALKHFIDYWKFPDSFEGRPVAFVGLGGRFGGLRAVEHMQQIFGYRNAFVFPQRVFLINVPEILKDGKIVDAGIVELMKTQARDFHKFIRALESAGLDANSRKSDPKP